MVRPLRLEYPGAVYHVTSRGNARNDIFIDAGDRRMFLELLDEQVRQHGWICYAYCLMDNHYHLLLETPEANLSRGMRGLNGCYTQRFNRRHQRVGHVFQGRYKSILVEKEAHLLELCRYIVLNPVRAGMVAQAGQWMWSSYADTTGDRKHPAWLSVGEVLALFLTDSGLARKRYRTFVQDGVDAASPWQNLRGQVYLGDEHFINRMQLMIDHKHPGNDIPAAQRHPSRPEAGEVLDQVCRIYGLSGRNAVLDRRNREPFQVSIFLLRRACHMALKEVATLAGVSIGRVSQIQNSMQNIACSRKDSLLRERYKVKT